MTIKMVSLSVRYLFYQPIDEKIKTWTLRSSAKENPYMEKALFDWPIVLQYDVKAEYRLISRKFSGVKFFHPIIRTTPNCHTCTSSPSFSTFCLEFQVFLFRWDGVGWGAQIFLQSHIV